MKILKKGCACGEVKILQQTLNIDITGIFDSKTENAVREFQKANNLSIDGIVGPKTWAALGFENTQTKRKITKIVVHCTAGNPKNTAADIVAYHTRPVSQGGRGWSTPGYHYIVEENGKIVNTVPEEKVSNGTKGHNADSINVCYTGGINLKTGEPEDTRTPKQKEALIRLLTLLRKKYPTAKIYGHRDFAKKACPSFDAKDEYKNL